MSACGGGDGNGDGDGNGGSRDFQDAIQPEAQQYAEAIVLTFSDFPDGWRADAPAAAGEDDQEAFNECVGADYSGLTIIGEAHSDDFLMGDAVASSDVGVFETVQTATQAYAERAHSLEGDEADTCLPLLLGEPPGDIEITSLEVDELSFTPPTGVDDADAWQATATVEGKAGSQDEGLSETVYSDLVMLRKDDTIHSVTTTDIATPFDPELRDQLVAAVADRMAE